MSSKQQNKAVITVQSGICPTFMLFASNMVKEMTMSKVKFVLVTNELFRKD